MKIGLFLKKILSNTHCPGVWGDEIWANSLAKGLQKLLPKDKVFVFGTNLGFEPEVDIAIYFHLFSDRLDVKWHGKKNVFIQQNYSPDTAHLERLINPYIELSKAYKTATISPTLAAKHGWELLYPSVDIDLFKPVKPDTKYACDVLYVGNNIKGQEKTLKYLTGPAEYKRFGNGFDEGITLKESITAFSSVLTNLNFFFKMDLEIITARIFQIAACKGLVMSEERPAIKGIFGDSMLWIDDTKDVQFQIKNLVRLAKDQKLAAKMKEQAYEIVIKNYNSDTQAKLLWEWING